jgi:hypothetical protein
MTARLTNNSIIQFIKTGRAICGLAPTMAALIYTVKDLINSRISGTAVCPIASAITNCLAYVKEQMAMCGWEPIGGGSKRFNPRHQTIKRYTHQKGNASQHFAVM